MHPWTASPLLAVTVDKARMWNRKEGGGALGELERERERERESSLHPVSLSLDIVAGDSLTQPRNPAPSRRCTFLLFHTLTVTESERLKNLSNNKKDRSC